MRASGWMVEGTLSARVVDRPFQSLGRGRKNRDVMNCNFMMR